MIDIISKYIKRQYPKRKQNRENNFITLRQIKKVFSYFTNILDEYRSRGFLHSHLEVAEVLNFHFLFWTADRQGYNQRHKPVGH